MSRGRSALLAVVACAAMTMTACAGAGPLADPSPSASTPSSETAAQPDPEMASARSRTKERFLDALAVLPAGEYTAAFGYSEYSSCSDNGADWEVSANRRLDHVDPRPSTGADAQRIRDALASAGWDPLESDVSPGGIRDLGDRWLVTAARDDLRIDMSLYADQEHVLISVSGPCLPATPAQAEAYSSAGGQRFPVPRTVGGS